MGGYGSGRWHRHTKKDTVEDSWVLSMDKLVRDGLIGRRYAGGTLTWRKVDTGKEVASVTYRLEPTADGGLIFRLLYTAGGDKDKKVIDEPILLQRTYPYFGGFRCWFTCPLLRNNRPCQRRVSKLYLPPGGRYFGCRHCYDLTYTSCQESHKYDSFFDSFAQIMRDKYPKVTGRDVKELLDWSARRRQ